MLLSSWVNAKRNKYSADNHINQGNIYSKTFRDNEKLLATYSHIKFSHGQ